MKKCLSLLLFVLIFIGCNKPDYLDDFKRERKEVNEDFRNIPIGPRINLSTYKIKKEIINNNIKIEAVILLDFDGHTVSGTSWNYAGDIIATPSGLNPQQIQYIVDSVTYDFRQLRILVTTNERLYDRAPLNKRIRVIITQNYQWYGSMAGGVSYTNSFNWGDNTPCFVFSNLLQFNPKYIFEAASHEAGHTLGCRHQGLLVNGAYQLNNQPQANGYTYIMGMPYYHPSEFGVGINIFGSIQDDIAMMNTNLNR